MGGGSRGERLDAAVLRGVTIDLIVGLALTPMALTDATRPSLLIAVRDPANQIAWEEFVSLYTPLVFGHCVSRGLQEADAADVAQEVLRAVASAIAKFDYDRRRGSFRGWLLTVTRSKLANFFSARARRGMETGETAVVDLANPEPSPAEAASWEKEYHARVLQWAMDRVRGEFQANTWEAFHETAIQHRPVAEVAQALGVSAGAIYIARSRVIARLRDCVLELDGEGEWPFPIP